MRIALFFLLLHGCVKQATLAQLTSKALRVSVAATGGLGVELQYDDTVLCQNIGDNVRVTLNNQALELFTKGDRSVGAGGDTCDFPLWESATTNSDPQLARFSMSDKSETLSASFDNLFSTRGYTLATAGAAAAGDTVSLAWSPSSDDYDPNQLKIIFAPASGTGAIVAQGAQITVTAGKLSFALPAGSPNGPGNLIVSGSANAHVSTCTGVDRCAATFEVASLIPFTVQ